MADYTIEVKNESGVDDRVYFLFCELPTVKGGSPEIFQNVYIAAPGIASGHGTAVFDIITQAYAVCGTHPGEDIGSNVTVVTGDWQQATLAQTGVNGSRFTMTAGSKGDTALFDTSLTKQDVTTGGSFENDTESFSFPNAGKWHARALE